ncbi:unnamed protein product [Closterium sp. NIES-54]
MAAASSSSGSGQQQWRQQQAAAADWQGSAGGGQAGQSSIEQRVQAEQQWQRPVAAAAVASSSGSRSSPESAPCSCRRLSHETLLWHHHLGHPSLLRLRGMASRLLVSGLPRSLPPLPQGPLSAAVLVPRLSPDLDLRRRLWTGLLSWDGLSP